MRIELDIERLVLVGFPGADGRRIGAAVEAELTRLLAARVPQRISAGLSAPRVDAGSFAARPNDSPGTLGRTIAGCVSRGLDR